MDDEEILRLPPEERLAAYISHMQNTRNESNHKKDQERQKQTKQRKQELFKRKQQEGKFDKVKHPSWKLGDRHTPQDLSFKDCRYLPNKDIHPRDLFRVTNFISRTFDYPKTAFKGTKNEGGFFGNTDEKFLSAEGRRIIGKNKEDYANQMEKRRLDELKIKKVTTFGPRWRGNSLHGGFFNPISADYYNFNETQADKYTHEKPFLRTSKYGGVFSRVD